MKISVIALREFYYDKRMVPKDESVDIEEKDLHILELAQAVVRKAEEKAEAKTKRRYQRRDMTADGS